MRPPGILQQRRQRDLGQARSRGFEGTCGGVHRVLHVGARVGPDVCAHQRHARRGRRGAIDAQVAARHRGGRECHVGHTSPIKSDGVERPRVALHADGRDELVGRLEPCDAAVGRRPDHRSRGLRAGRDRHHAGGDRRGGAGGRAARCMLEIMWVARLAGLLMRELGRHRLAENDAAGAAQHRHRRGIARRLMALVGGRAVFGRHICRVVDVLQSDREAAQRQRAQAPGVLARDRARLVDREIGERADILLARGNGCGAEIDHALGRELARLDAARKIEGGEQAVGTGEHGRVPVARAR